MSAAFSPKPPNLTYGVFKYRSTRSGNPPVKDDILRTITRGIPNDNGAGMPGFAILPLATRLALVEEVWRVAEFSAEPEATALSGSLSDGSVERGAVLYGTLGCGICHGERGDGNGVAADSLTDDMGYAVSPRNLRRGIYGGGGAPEDIALRILTGLDGSAMPSFAMRISTSELWDLVAYVRSLDQTRDTSEVLQ